MEQKKHYSEAELEVVLFDAYVKCSDIITTSGEDFGSSGNGSIDNDSWDT